MVSEWRHECTIRVVKATFDCSIQCILTFLYCTITLFCCICATKLRQPAVLYITLEPWSL